MAGGLLLPLLTFAAGQRPICTETDRTGDVAVTERRGREIAPGESPGRFLGVTPLEGTGMPLRGYRSIDGAESE